MHTFIYTIWTFGKVIGIVLFSYVVTVFNPNFAFAQEEKYEIKQYEAILTLNDGSTDVDVQLNITYDVFATPKSKGFKYIGSFEPSNLRAFEDRGRIAVLHTKKRENLVTWFFPTPFVGEKSVRVEFTLPDALRSAKHTNSLSLPWLGVFRVPIRHSIFRIVFPANVRPQIRSASAHYALSQDENGKTIALFTQSPLIRKDLYIEFAPIIAKNPYWRFKELAASADDFIENADWEAIGMFAFIVSFFSLGFMARRARSKASGGNCGFGACSGSSGSCSGGGGCGGGGCGGGCGG